MELLSVPLIVALASGIWWGLRGYVRQPSDVLLDLGEARDEGDSSETTTVRVSRRVVLGGSYWEMGVLTLDERRTFELHQRAIPVLALFGAILVAYMVGARSASALLLASANGFLVGVLLASRRRRAFKDRFKKDLEFYLPTVMEQVVMGVHAGLDVLPALKVVLDLDERSTDGPRPVTKLFRIVHDLTEKGTQFEDALQLVASKTPCTALRHAFIHLALARKEGGELILPLRELSDATQLHFQDSVEEEIAKMPVRATAPLVCVFAGLMICFMTVPVLQVVSVTDRAQSHTMQDSAPYESTMGGRGEKTHWKEH